MPNKQDLRARMDRLTKYSARADDLMQVLLWLRFNSRSAVLRELGDFIAHSETREKGIVTDHLRAFLAKISLSADRFEGKAFQFEAFPRDVFVLAESNIAIFSEERIKLLAGVSRERARKSVLRLKESYSLDRGTNIYRIQKRIHEDDLNMLHKCLTMEITSVFDSRRLWTDFVNECLRLDIISDDKVADSSYLRDFVTLYAVVAMHHTRIDLCHNKYAWLQAGKMEETLVVFGGVDKLSESKGGSIYY